MQKPVEKPIKFVKNAATLGKTYPVTHIEAVIDGNGKTLPDILELMLSTIPSTSGDIMSYTDSEGNTRYIASTDDPSGIVGGGGMTELTWYELKTLRDNSQLAVGSLYRITDYQCTTTQENTKSAGHQFDIVLLALSANKLAEEGWAMMHDNIYDVTFADGVTKKCYIYEYAEGSYNVVEPDTLLGTSGGIGVEFVSIDDVNKVLICDPDYGPNSDGMENEGLTYNYFQNSNLSAWKVWYCLDNDTARFAWADDSVDEDSPASITIMGEKGEINTCYRDSADDLNNLFAWKEGDSSPVYTASQTPNAGDTIYYEDGTDTGATVNSFTPAHEGTGLPNGRGVIYRLIDEWGNDVAYDFKNIQFIRPTTDGNYDPEGEDTWVYTFSYNYDGAIIDTSIHNGIEGDFLAVFNKIAYNFELANNVFFNVCNICSADNSIGNTIIGCNQHILYNTFDDIFTSDAFRNGAIYINNKKVLTEE